MPYDQDIGVRKMHQTTVRFGEDLWEALEAECARLGVSVAQYLREAALTRLVYAAGRRGDDEFEFALELAIDGSAEPRTRGAKPRTHGAEPRTDGAEPQTHGVEPQTQIGGLDRLERVTRAAGSSMSAKEHAVRESSAAAAVAAQGRLARQRARELRERAMRIRGY